MKKILMLGAAVLMMQAVPALAESAPADGPHKGRMFEKHDTNADGVITEEEFLVKAKERFAMMDADSDGKITMEEGKAAHEKMRAKMKEWKDKNGAAPAEAE